MPINMMPVSMLYKFIVAGEMSALKHGVPRAVGHL
jgi:hypothetical protein